MTVSKNQMVVLAQLVLLLGAAFAVYRSTFAAMASVWLGSSTFLYGILILPMSAYLIWRQRHHWLRLVVSVSVPSVLLLTACIFLWVVSTLVSVQVVSQFAFVGILIALIWAALGSKAISTLRFPLAYAFLAVPVGEFLIPPLMEWTAFAAVRALQITGVPVLREGMYFSLPSGNFEVIEACSGIRFLLVTVVLGAYYAYETYSSRKKQILFIASAALIIVLTNGVRAYVVVLIAHYSKMQWGTGQSHLIIGGLIFLTVITTMFWYGRKFSDVVAEESEFPVDGASENSASSIGGRVLISLVAIAMLLSGPTLVAAGQARLVADLPEPSLPMAAINWSGPGSPTLGYEQVLADGPRQIAGQYTGGGQAVEIHIAFFTEQRQGSELVGWDSRAVDDEVWSELDRQSVDLRVADLNLGVQSVAIERGSRRLLLWHWFDVGGQVTARPSVAKFRQTWNMIRGDRRGDALIILATTIGQGGVEESAGRLEDFVTAHFQGLALCLRPIAGVAGCGAIPTVDGVER